MRKILQFGLVALLLLTNSSIAIAQQFDPKPWLEDLAQAKEAFAIKYANLEWAQFESQTRLSDLLVDTEVRVRSAGSDADARAAFDRLARRLGDGHVQFVWPSPTASSTTATAGTPDICADYSPAYAAPPLAGAAPDYVALHTPQSAIFPVGVIAVGPRRIGVIKIGMFGPHATPAYCHAAAAALGVSPAGPCDEACQDRIEQWASVRMTEDFAAQVKALETANADVLLVDIAGNGGGSEWAETAARMVTPVRLVAERLGFVRGPLWTNKLDALERELRAFAKTSSPSDSAELLKLADRAASAKTAAQTHCDSAPLWAGSRPACTWLGGGLWATGLLAAADPRALSGKPWASLVFEAAEVPYQEGIWSGPLIVLVDRGTGSASEEFAAELQATMLP